MVAYRHIMDGHGVLATGEYLYVDILQGSNSGRDTLGHLKLAANPHFRAFGKVFSYGWLGSKYTLRGCQNSAADLSQLSSEYNKVLASLENTCRAKMRGKLYQGSASIGVTAASYKQSRDMIVTRSRQLTQSAGSIITSLSNPGPKSRKRRLADAHLETIFGWQPLLSDMHSAATSVIQLADARDWVKARSSQHVDHADDGTFIRVNAQYNLSVCYGAQVLVKNPNTWLLERAGLLNPAAVAWDLVPWSFVVNMFVNTGSIVNSITDFAGLEFSEFSYTRSIKGTYQYEMEPDSPRNHAWSHWFNRRKTRSVGGQPPLPNLQLKLPEVSWETAAMAASLAVQQATRAVRLVAQFNKLRKHYTE